MISKSSLVYVKLALPKGNLMEPVSILIQEAGLGISDYSRNSRLYHLKSDTFSNVSAKIFQEKDIPIQVAIGNYDIGICGSDWLEELLAKYPHSHVIKLTVLGIMPHKLYLAASCAGSLKKEADLYRCKHSISIASEYPNLCEQAAIDLRLRRFKIFPVWGAAEFYPPENADLVLIKTSDGTYLDNTGLIPLRCIKTGDVLIIVNIESWQKKNLKTILLRLNRAIPEMKSKWTPIPLSMENRTTGKYVNPARNDVWFALPDGHQCPPTSDFLLKCGLNIKGYSPDNLKRRPLALESWLKIKVIRPQDIPMQVANGNFDLAVTGQDWFLDHIYRFPSSPTTKVLDLNFGKVKIVSVVSGKLPVNNTSELKSMVDKGDLTPLRVATEYINIADYYLHNNHIKNYKIIPTWGATEALIPEDADLLIENTETGKTLAAHNLKIIHTLFASSACVIANKNSLKNKSKKARIYQLLEQFER